MQLKDYYSILELPPSASADEIKKAYRRLAHQYHPDKKNNDPYAAAQFTEIQEAYETLSNPLQKEYYLQQRWYAQSIGKKIKQETITPVNILKQMIELEKYVSKLDIHRMDQQGLFDYMQNILSDSTISTLNSFNETDINKEIVLTSLKGVRVLPYHFILPFAERLKKLIVSDKLTIKKIDQFVRHHKQTDYWEKRKVWIILLLVLLICIGIFFTSNSQR
ncbi:MAG: DnaJ domain-containing protein [Chitinophagaceae bacterium]